MISSWLNTKEVYFPPNATLKVQHATSGARRPEGTNSNHRNKQASKQNKNPVQSLCRWPVGDDYFKASPSLFTADNCRGKEKKPLSLKLTDSWNINALHSCNINKLKRRTEVGHVSV